MKKRNLMEEYNTTAYLYNMRYKEEQELKISFLLGRIKPKEDEILIDVGCGTGILFKMVKCKEIIGIDISINMIREAKKIGKAELILADGENLPLRDEIADIVMSVTVIDLAENKEKFFSEIIRCLKRNGRFGISILKHSNIPKNIPEDTEIYESDTMKSIFLIGKK
ncbi:MAG: class I SAM-dependent methyltransferase [Candidatus Verstraetearchaeota archaeon]|jgi:ubiquinone/menaquinone biosynthesis C-methylase UbiE|nr:class I SAM-dependent methyltransferase [Candidatus Methanomethylicia archaeon]NHV45603.1 class I SAM-dependent methyltransferase [Candidatus Verstraetearchaeota archaeon]